MRIFDSTSSLHGPVTEVVICQMPPEKLHLPVVLVAVLSLCCCAMLLVPNEPLGTPLYLHIYSNRYAIHSMTSDLPPHPRPFQRIATIGVWSGREFFAVLPNHYEPEMEIRGTVVKRGDVLDTNFTLWVQDVGNALEHKQHQPISINKFEPFGFEGEFYFAVADTTDLRVPAIDLSHSNPGK